MNTNSTPTVQMNTRRPWNKDRLIRPKPPLKLKDIWAIRFHLQLAERTRDLALFNLVSTANCAVAISLNFEYEMLHKMDELLHAPQ